MKKKKLLNIKTAMLEVHKHPKNWAAIRLADGAKRYCLKYCLKPYQKAVPKEFSRVGRFWGCSYDVKPEEIIEVSATDEEIRDWLKDHPVTTWDLLPKYIFPRG